LTGMLGTGRPRSYCRARSACLTRNCLNKTGPRVAP
jgi:hypothetical protein